MKSIVSEDVILERGLFKPDSYMTDRLPEELKERFQGYLTSVPDVLVGDCTLRDPVTGKRYETTNIIREKDGYIWSTHTIYMFKHYDIKLSDEFLRMFIEEGINGDGSR